MDNNIIILKTNNGHIITLHDVYVDKYGIHGIHGYDMGIGHVYDIPYESIHNGTYTII